MSSLDDAPTLLQDIVSPDFKAISARLEAFEKSMHDRFEASEALNRQRYETVDQRFTAAEKLNDARFETLLHTIQSGNAATDAKIDRL